MRIVLLMLLASLAGCIEVEEPEGTVWHIQGTQCQEYPWGDTAGGDATQPGLDERMKDYYGFEFTGVKVTSDGSINPSVCGARSDQHVEATVVGHEDSLLSDGWAKGTTPERS